MGRLALLGAGFLALSGGTAVVLAYWCATGCRGMGRSTMAPTSTPQRPAHEMTMSAGMVPLLFVMTPVTRPSLRSNPVTGVMPSLGGQSQPVRGDVQAAEDDVLAQQRVQPAARLGADEARLDAPGRRVAVFPLQVLEPLRRLGHFEAADLVEAADREQLLDGVAGKRGQRLGRIRLEHEARRVRCRASRHLQRALLDDGDVGPSARDQLVGNVGADDASANDDDARGGHGFYE
ncbi:hypothetical protein HYQ46_000191 [Verticillium longisporum]|nr:hypothetical protein HYQ46_000191 [Verticillium longisporum]